MNAYTRFCATELVGEEGVKKLEERGWVVADRAELEALNLRVERLNQTIDDIIEAKRKDLEIIGRNIRGIESVRSQVMRGDKKIHADANT